MTLTTCAEIGRALSIGLIGSEHDRRIHPHGTACRMPRRRDGDEAQGHDRRYLRQRIPGFDPEEQPSHRLRGRERAGQAEADP